MADKPKPANPILRRITEKREQLEAQILGGTPTTYDAYQAAIGAYRTLTDLENFTTETLKQGDHIDD